MQLLFTWGYSDSSALTQWCDAGISNFIQIAKCTSVAVCIFVKNIGYSCSDHICSSGSRLWKNKSTWTEPTWITPPCITNFLLAFASRNRKREWISSFGWKDRWISPKSNKDSLHRQPGENNHLPWPAQHLSALWWNSGMWILCTRGIIAPSFCTDL